MFWAIAYYLLTCLLYQFRLVLIGLPAGFILFLFSYVMGKNINRNCHKKDDNMERFSLIWYCWIVDRYLFQCLPFLCNAAEMFLLYEKCNQYSMYEAIHKSKRILGKKFGNSPPIKKRIDSALVTAVNDDQLKQIRNSLMAPIYAMEIRHAISGKFYLWFWNWMLGRYQLSKDDANLPKRHVKKLIEK